MLTVHQIAAKLKVSPRYVRRLCQVGKLSAIKHGRDWLVTEKSFAEYLKRA